MAINPLVPRRLLMGAARDYLTSDIGPREGPDDQPPRLTPRAIENSRMPRSRDRILANIDDMYREAFERAKAAGDEAQMATLDFAYRREQLYFEILLDIRDGFKR
ncbi:MAG: hypothetical protein ACRENI_05375 [Gemmatimonadaceae bacterium]